MHERLMRAGREPIMFLMRVAAGFIVSVVLLAYQFLLMLAGFRLTLLIATVPTLGVAIAAASSKCPIKRTLLWLVAVNTLLLVLPFDVAVRPVGHFMLGVRSVEYGLLKREAREAARRGEFVSAGCVIPPWPARWALLIGY